MCHQASRSQGSPRCTPLSEPARKASGAVGFSQCDTLQMARLGTVRRSGDAGVLEVGWECVDSTQRILGPGTWYMTQQWQIDAIQRLCRHTDCVPASKGEPAASSHSTVRLCGAVGVGLCSRLWAYTASAGCQACLPCPGELSWSPPTSRCFPNVKILPTQT